jgi:1-acyl-sn-glycerol-3-phosphate acyltransferase
MVTISSRNVILDKESNMLRRDFLLFIIRGLFRLLTHVETIGMENIPEKGGCILAVNHMSRIDPALILLQIKRKDVSGLIADKYKKNLFFRWIVEAIDGIWIHREDADFHALRQATAYLKRGGMLGIAPEGTRSTVANLISAKMGVAYLADKAEVPVLPVAVCGTEDALKQVFSLRRPHVRVEYGRLIYFPPVDRQHRNQMLQRNTDEIMCQIAAMLPPAYRGEYAQHPRLLEILQGKNAIQSPI